MHQDVRRLCGLVGAILGILASGYSSEINSNYQANVAHACICGTADMYKVIDSNSSVIFSGKVSMIEDLEETRRAHVDVEQVWKGDEIRNGSNVVVETRRTSCEYYFEDSGSYLIHAGRAEKFDKEDIGTDMMYSTQQCTLTHSVEDDLSKNRLVMLVDFLGGKEYYWHSKPLSVSYNLEGQNYTVFGKTTDNLRVDHIEIDQSRGLTLLLDSPTEQNSMVELVLPKAMMDGIMTDFDVIVGKESMTLYVQGLKENSTHTTVGILLPPETDQVIVRGSYIVPEFGILAMIILASTVAGIVIWTTSTVRKMDYS